MGRDDGGIKYWNAGYWLTGRGLRGRMEGRGTSSLRQRGGNVSGRWQRMGWTSILWGVEGVPIAGLSDERGLTDKFHELGSKAASKDERGGERERLLNSGGASCRRVTNSDSLFLFPSWCLFPFLGNALLFSKFLKSTGIQSRPHNISNPGTRLGSPAQQVGSPGSCAKL